jgi:hypothetical protein
MKRFFHIPVVLVTILWVSYPHLVADNTLFHHSSCLKQQSDYSTQAILLNFPAKSDIRIELPGEGFLPEVAKTESIYYTRAERWPRDFTSFIVSHHVYTQFTSSYL